METKAGLDLGNTKIKLHIDGKNASIPAMYAFDEPIVVGKTGRELKTNCFSLLFDRGDTDIPLWFGQDVLASQSVIHKFDEAKYDASHISILFRAVLYEWSRKHGVDLSALGKLSIVASMPPGLYQQNKPRLQAEKAYRKAFNRGQSHVKIRPDKGQAVQVVTQFLGLVREAVAFGSNVLRKGKLILIIDLGGGTNDIALFNGSSEPLKTWTLKNGLLHTFAQINPVNPNEAELKILRNKSNLPGQIVAYYSSMENLVRRAIRDLSPPVNRIYIIGGGAALMPKSTKPAFQSLADKVIIKDEYANAEANYREASK